MIASRRDTSNIFGGCLAYLRDDLSAVLPEGQNLNFKIGIKGIIGSETQYNLHNTPYDKAPSFFEIYFGNRYIFPIAYSMMGRRDPTYKVHFLKSWNFFGRDEAGVWNLLHTQTDQPFTFGENRTYPLSVKKRFNGFKIQMIDTSTDGGWIICLGQFDVFGDIYKRSSSHIKCTKQIARCRISAFIIVIISI